jgi:protein-S-isoprenylcysteine O-methyltransferase Ste14
VRPPRGIERVSRHPFFFGLGLVLAGVLCLVHDHIFHFGGAWVIIVIVGGAAVALLQAARRARRE